MNSEQLILGESEPFLKVLEKVSMLASLNRPILIVGERGTGKELIAKRLHFLSNRWEQTYLSVNCSSFNEELLDAELFGCEVGAFTGAIKRRIGRFERAHKGTLFLDELATMKPTMQQKLLRVLEYGTFDRLGGQSSISVDVRVIGATNEDLPTLVENRKFRADLLDRLSFDVITLPPLRERKEDILLLAEHFAVKMTQQLARDHFAGFSPQVEKTLLEYEWPGNVRELKNTVERAVCYQSEPSKKVSRLILDPFSSPFRPLLNLKNNKKDAEVNYPIDQAGDRFVDQVSFFERQLLIKALKGANYNQKSAAAKLGLTYHQLRGLLRKYKKLV